MPLILSLLLSTALAQKAPDHVCSPGKPAHFLIFETHDKNSKPIYQVGLCDSVPGYGPTKLRALSRRELADALVQSRAELGPEAAKFWNDNLGISLKQLEGANDDLHIANQMMVFPQGENLESVKRAAEWLRTKQGITSSTEHLKGDRSDDVLQDWFGAFESLCRVAGGRWMEKRDISVEDGLALDNQTTAERAEAAQGKVVCKCGGYAFSNPVDYRCDKSPGASRLFIETVGSGGSAPPTRGKKTRH